MKFDFTKCLDHTIFNKLENRLILIQQYYNPNTKERQREIDEVLRNNIDNMNFDLFVIFVEINSTISNKTLLQKISQNERIIIIENVPRIKYSDIFNFANTYLNNNIIVFSNNDIYFDETINLVRDLDFNNLIIALLKYKRFNNRYKYLHCDNLSWYPKNEPFVYSQDTWVLKTPVSPSIIKRSNFLMGVNTADCYLLTVFLNHSYNIINPIFRINTLEIDDVNFIDDTKRYKVRAIDNVNNDDYFTFVATTHLLYPNERNLESYKGYKCICKDDVSGLYDQKYFTKVDLKNSDNSILFVFPNTIDIDYIFINIAEGKYELLIQSDTTEKKVNLNFNTSYQITKIKFKTETKQIKIITKSPRKLKINIDFLKERTFNNFKVVHNKYSKRCFGDSKNPKMSNYVDFVSVNPIHNYIHKNNQFPKHGQFKFNCMFDPVYFKEFNAWNLVQNSLKNTYQNIHSCILISFMEMIQKSEDIEFLLKLMRKNGWVGISHSSRNIIFYKRNNLLDSCKGIFFLSQHELNKNRTISYLKNIKLEYLHPIIKQTSINSFIKNIEESKIYLNI
jgi:hypothetical protein